jgi:hypothetical protein
LTGANERVVGADLLANGLPWVRLNGMSIREKVSSVGACLMTCLKTYLLACLAACGTDTDLPNAAELKPVPYDQLFELQRVIELGAAPDDPIGRVNCLTFWRGRLVIVDGIQANVKVFSQSGELELTLGRAGEGPGEFRRPGSAVAVADGRLAVLDQLLMRMSFFDSLGAFDTSWAVAAVAGADVMVVEGGERLLVTARRVQHVSDGRTAEPLREYGVHPYDLEGRPGPSFRELPTPTHRYEGSFSAVQAATVVGATVISVSMSSNVVQHHELGSGREWSVSIGDQIYTPPEFPAREMRDLAELSAWAQTQTWVQGIIPLDSRHYLLRFVTWDSSRTPWYQYALASTEGRTGAVTLSTPTKLVAGSDGIVYGSEMSDTGQVRISMLKWVK